MVIFTWEYEERESTDAVDPVEDGPVVGLGVRATEADDRLNDDEHGENEAEHRVRRAVLKHRQRTSQTRLFVILNPYEMRFIHPRSDSTEH